MTTLQLRALLGTELPLIQAPMAGSQGSALALAVGAAGGLGSLPAAMLAPDALAAELAALRAGTRRPFNVNFFCHETPAPDDAREQAWRAQLAPYYAEFDIDPRNIVAGPGRQPFSDAIADLVEPFAPPIVSFHFGLPSPALVDRVKRWGGRVLSSATTVEEALWLQQRGVDAIIAQGLEAGGHRGMFLTRDIDSQLGTLALVRRLVRSVNVPVIAAGGIADAEGVAAALALGASGVQVGTAYLRCPEASTSAVHRQALADAANETRPQTALTNLFSGRPARGLMNRLMRELGPIRREAPEFPLATAAVAPLRAAAERLGRDDFSPLWSGQNASGALALPAAEITARLARGFGL